MRVVPPPRGGDLPLPTLRSSCSCHRCRTLPLVRPGGLTLPQRAAALRPLPRRLPTASRRAAVFLDLPPVPPDGTTALRCRTAATRSSPPPFRRISSRPPPPALPPRKRLRTDCSAAVPVHRRWPPVAPDPPPGCAGPAPSVRRPCPLNSGDSGLRTSKKGARF